MQRNQAPGLDTRSHSMPVHTLYSSKKSIRQSNAPPPPYTGPPTPNVSEEALSPPHLSSRAPTPTPRLPNPQETSRRLPTPPNPRIITDVERATASPNQPEPSSSQVTGLSPPVPRSSRVSPLPTLLLTPSLSPQSYSSSSHLPPAPSSAPVSKSRSVFSVLKLHKSARKATAQIANQTARKVTEETRARIEEEEAARQAAEHAARERDEEVARRARAQAEARELVRSSIESLLLCGLTSDEERTSVFSQCSQACNDCGLDLSAVLQEPLIEGQLPVYWAILNRPAKTPEVDDEALNALIVTLLNTCRSLNETSIDSVRLACMWTSNNTLLQHLFWHYLELSPLSMSDRMLLGSFGGDIAEVGETRDGTGAFVAHVKIRRFRLRMNSSKVVKIEFITFERLWTARFFVSTERTQEGVSESKWLFSLELADNSTPAWFNADLLVPGHPHQTTDSGNNEPIFSIAVGCVGHALQPGSENAIKVRLDEGPMRLHWINDSLTLLDTEGTLRAELHVRMTPPIPPVPPLSPDNSDTWSQVSSIPTTFASSSHLSLPKSPTKRSKTREKVEVPDKPVYTSLRKGGRYK